MLGFALSTTAAAGVVYLARQRKHLPLPMWWFSLSSFSLVGVASLHWRIHTQQPKRGRIRKRRETQVHACTLCSGIYFLLLFQLFFSLSLSISLFCRLYRNCPSLFYSLSLYRPKLDLFQMIYSFRFAISYAATVLRALFQKAIHFGPPALSRLRFRHKRERQCCCSYIDRSL